MEVIVEIVLQILFEGGAEVLGELFSKKRRVARQRSNAGPSRTDAFVAFSVMAVATRAPKPISSWSPKVKSPESEENSEVAISR